MLKTFTIVANEVIGLSATECTLNIACLWILIQRKSLAQVLIGVAML